MSTAKNNVPSLIVPTILTLILFCVFIVLQSDAQAQSEQSMDKSKDQTLTVQIKADGCDSVVFNESADNCTAEHGLGRGKCGQDDECICSKKLKRITWKAGDGNEIKIKFANNSPFNHQCELISGSDGIISCKVKNKGDFQYSVHVKGCATFHDPRIVVE